MELRSAPWLGAGLLLMLIAPLANAQSPAAFKFGPADEQLLNQANQLDREFETKGLVYHDARAEALLRRVGSNLLGKIPNPDEVDFRLRILRDPMINAFSLPNGSIYVNTGLVSCLENEAQLAAVLSHEITHVIQRHTYLVNRNTRKKALGLNIASIIAGTSAYFPGAGLFAFSLQTATQISEVIAISTIYGYSREMETDADRAGYQRLIAAGYDGTAMVRALQLLDEKLEYEPVEPFWKTHPKLEARIKAVNQYVAEKNSMRPIEPPHAAYLGAMAGVIRDNISEDLVCRRARTAVARALRLVATDPTAEDETLLGDGYTALGAKAPQPTQAELSKQGKKDNRKRILKLTEAEEQAVLLALPNSQATLTENRTKAESAYRKALGQEPDFAPAHRGLGMLYQDEGNKDAAVREYRAYLKLAPAGARDRLRFEQRLQRLASSAGSTPGEPTTK